MREKGRWASAGKFVVGSVTAAAAILSIAESVTDTGLMGPIALPPVVYVLLSVGLGAFFLCLIWTPTRKWFQERRPSVRFRSLHGGIYTEWWRIKHDRDPLQMERRVPGDIYQDRVALCIELAKLRIYAPPPQDDQSWLNFVVDLAPLSQGGLIKGARQRYGDPNWLNKLRKRGEAQRP